MEDLFLRITKNAESLTEEDLDLWILPSLIDHYKPNLRKLTWNVYRNNFDDLSLRAFTEIARIELRSALVSFLFKKQYWTNNRDLNQYLLKTLKVTSIKLWANANFAKHNYICPACAVYGRKEVLLEEEKLLVCNFCSNEITNNLLDISLIKLHSVFSKHSKKGFKCPDCKRFIPKSSLTDKLICPYVKCSYFTNDLKNLKETHHPKKINIKRLESLDATVSNSSIKSNYTRYNPVFNKDVLTSYYNIHKEFSYNEVIDFNTLIEKDFDLLKNVISEQKNQIKISNPAGTLVQKTLMYQAYENILDKFPIEMIGYLVHLKIEYGLNIQSKIFQEYVSLIENELPFSIKKNGKTIDLLSLTDSNLALFLGKSEYEATVNGNTIPNFTKEIYVGGRNFKNYGPCFIGRLIDVIDIDNNISLLKHVTEYNFSSIIINNIKPNTKVLVKHYRIHSHYEMGHLVFVQAIRKLIVDSAYLRKNKKKRIII